MSETPAEWTDADPSSLPPTHDITHDADGCARCGTPIDMGDYCERCHELVERTRVRR